jgi:Fic family protein
LYNPKYRISNKILKNLNRISAAHNLIVNAPLIPKWEARLKKEAKVRSAHFSTAIEGNKLTLGEVKAIFEGKKIYAKKRDKQEVINYKKVLEFVDKEPELIIETIKKINEITLEKLDEKERGQFRKIQNYIVKEKEGIREIVYIPPTAKQVPKLMKDLIEWIKKSVNEDISPIIIAGIAHYELVSIHPFIEGNGRTARALATLILYKLGYDTKRLFSLEEYYDQDLKRYYSALQSGQKNRNGEDLSYWLEYFSEGIANEMTKIEKQILDLSRDKILKEKIGQLELNHRQIKAVAYLQKKGKISRSEYVKLTKCSAKTAFNDLHELLDKKLIKQKGGGKYTFYILAHV